MSKTPYLLTRPRKTMRLSRTYRTVQGAFDFDSALGLDYAQAWVQRAGGLRPPTAAVLRRAVAVYLLHLDRISDADRAAEVREVQRAGEGRLLDEGDQQTAQERLSNAVAAEQLPAWQTVIPDPALTATLAGFDARVGELFDHLDRQAAQRPRRRKRSTNAQDAAPQHTNTQ